MTTFYQSKMALPNNASLKPKDNLKPKTGYMTTRMSHNGSPMKQSQDFTLTVNDTPIRERKVKCDPYFKNESIHRKSID